MDVERPWCTPGLRAYQTMMEKDRQRRLHNQERLRELVRTHGSQVRVCCSHDPSDFERIACRSIDAPAQRGALPPSREESTRAAEDRA